MMVGSCGLLPWWGAGFRDLAAQEGLNDDHRASAFGAKLLHVRIAAFGAGCLVRSLIRLWLGIQQLPDLCDPVTTNAIREEACVSDAVEA